jgi:hypothetical protein
MKEIKFIKDCIYNQYEVNILTVKVLDKYFNVNKSPKGFKCIKPFILKYTIENVEG